MNVGFSVTELNKVQEGSHETHNVELRIHERDFKCGQ